MLSSVFSYILTKLENYSLCEFLINSFEALRNGKTTTTKSINISLKKCHTFIGYIEIDALLAHKGNIEFKILLVKTFSLKKKHKIKYFWLLYSQSTGIFNTLAHSESEAYSEPYQTSTIIAFCENS